MGGFPAPLLIARGMIDGRINRMIDGMLKNNKMMG
jgi:hypothetical protein